MEAAKKKSTILAWERIALAVAAVALLLFVFVFPSVRRYWIVQNARAEAEMIQIIGDVLETPEGKLYIQYLEAKNK